MTADSKAITILRRWIRAAIDGGPLVLADALLDARVFLHDLDAKQSAGPTTVADLSVRARNALDIVNGHVWRSDFSGEWWDQERKRMARKATPEAIFRAGCRAFRRQNQVGPATIAELESVLRANHYADRVDDWRAR